MDLNGLADPADITKDMYGEWKYTGSHEQAFLSYLNSSNQLVVTKDVAHPSSAMKLRRMYSVHPSNAKFKRMLITGGYNVALYTAV